MKLRSLTKNKKAQSNISNVLLFGIILIVVLAIGMIFAVGGTVIKIVSDNILPPLKNIDGLPGDQAIEKSVVVGEGIVGAIPWVTGGLYLVMLIGTLGIAYAFRITGERYLMILYFGICIIAIMGAILISNIYQDFHEDGTLIGTELQSQALLSFLLLYSPMLITIIAFVGGIIMFTGPEEVTGI